MKVRLIPENIVVDAYLPISSLDNLLVMHDDPAVIKEKGMRWETRKNGTYEIAEESCSAK